MKKLLALALASLVLAGCQSRPLSPYVSPRVTGRVVAADSRQPLAGVKVITGNPTVGTRNTSPPKGGERLQEAPAVRTDPNGRFILQSERVLTPFGSPGWFTLYLTFEQPGYERFLTNYSRLNLRTNTWQGEPTLDAGEVHLQPLGK